MIFSRFTLIHFSKNYTTLIQVHQKCIKKLLSIADIKLIYYKPISILNLSEKII